MRSRLLSDTSGDRNRWKTQFWHAYIRASEDDRFRSHASFVKLTKAFITRMTSLFGLSVKTQEEGWRFNARNAGNIKKSGRVLNWWMTWKAGSGDNSGAMINLSIASTVCKNSCK